VESSEGIGSVITDSNTDSSGQGNTDSVDVVIKEELTLRYDDRYVFPDKVKTIVSDSVTSKKARTEVADEAVLKVKSKLKSETVIASGTGVATVTHYWESKYPESKYPFENIAVSYQNPTTIAEVHTGVHYLQPGYNESVSKLQKRPSIFLTERIFVRKVSSRLDFFEKLCYNKKEIL